MGNVKNKLKLEDKAIHDWYRFVLSFPPHLIQEYIKKLNIDKNDIVLDPFCGTGTTNVECKKNGIHSIGIEANPITHFASTVKCNWTCYDTEELYNQAQKIAENAIAIIANSSTLRTLSEVENKLILKNSISATPLHQVLILRDEIYRSNSIYQDYYLLALAKHIVYSFSNLKFGPEVGISRKRNNTENVVSIWLDQVHTMKNDLELFETHNHVESKILLGDSRSINKMQIKDKINFVITSPPYPNEKDYSRTTRLESVILGYTKTKEDLRAQKKGFIRSNSKTIYKGDEDDLHIETIQSIIKISNEIEQKRLELNKTSGFEKLYATVVKQYFGGMARHLNELKPLLAHGAKLAYVVGDQASYFQIPIRTSLLLGEVAENIGYKVEDIKTFRKRFATATETWLNEDILILKYLGE